MNKQFKGKAIYNPSGKAGEYSYWACNFYVGCSNGCEYCYCKKGILKAVMGQDKPQLKKCFKSDEHALQLFESELSTNIIELQKHGLFFSFTTDPMLPETIGLTLDAVLLSNDYDVPVKILTKCTDWVDDFLHYGFGQKELYAFGFTLTGHDELEPNASPNVERIKAMEKLHNAGFKIFASIEPIIDFDSSVRMIEKSMKYCDLYKIGLMSGSKPVVEKLRSFVQLINWYGTETVGFKVYWKESISKFFTTNAWKESCCVDRDYNIFEP